MSTDTPQPTPADPPLPPRRSPWLHLLLLLVVFGSGMVCGGGLSAVLIRNQVRSVVHHPEQSSDRLLNLLNRALRLSDAQHEQIALILHRRQARLRQLRQAVQPQIEHELNAAVNEVTEVLTPTQRQRWRRIVDRLRGWRPPLPAEQP